MLIALAKYIDDSDPKSARKAIYILVSVSAMILILEPRVPQDLLFRYTTLDNTAPFSSNSAVALLSIFILYLSFVMLLHAFGAWASSYRKAREEAFSNISPDAKAALLDAAQDLQKCAKIDAEVMASFARLVAELRSATDVLERFKPSETNNNLFVTKDDLFKYSREFQINLTRVEELGGDIMAHILDLPRENQRHVRGRIDELKKIIDSGSNFFERLNEIEKSAVRASERVSESTYRIQSIVQEIVSNADELYSVSPRLMDFVGDLPKSDMVKVTKFRLVKLERVSKVSELLRSPGLDIYLPLSLGSVYSVATLISPEIVRSTIIFLIDYIGN